MRILPTGLAALALAGCHSPAPAGNGTMPNEAQVEAEFENQQDALAASIENDANADDANGSANDGGPTAYSCDNGTTVTVAYGDDGNATLVTGGKTIALKSVPAASGGKYEGATRLAPGKSLVWWSKDDGAMLIQAPRSAKVGKGETTVTCLATNPEP